LIEQICEHNVTVRRRTDLGECAGLTIAKAWDQGDEVGIVFTDGTVFFAYDDQDSNLSSSYRLDAHRLEKLGLMTREERLARQATEREAQAKAAIERERKEFQRLRAKFEDGGL
jgi:hypothetical protein